MSRWQEVPLSALLVCALTMSGCRTAPDAPAAADRRQRGEGLVARMSDHLAAAHRLSFTTDEELVRTRDRVRRVQKLSRQVVARRPDRLYFKVSGDRDMEAFYDGRRFTLVSHRDKVFGEFSAPPTLDDVVDMVGTQYDIPLPIGDLLSVNARQALMSARTTGGWVADETIDGVATARLEWHHPDRDWTVWIPASGAPLPKKMFVLYKNRTGLPQSTITFDNWTLDLHVPEGIFTARVPPDYEGVALLQRAAAVLPRGPDATPTATTGSIGR